MKSFTKCGLILVLGVLFSSLMMYKRIFDIKISNAENVSNNVHYMSKNNSDVITTVGDNKCTGLEFGEKCIFITHPYIRASLLVGVLSGYKNLEKRRSVRDTWKLYPGNWSLVFIIGLPCDEQCKTENATYKDLALVHDEDRYFGTSSILPVKSSTLYWIAERIKPDWILKTDDDSFVDIPRLINVTKTLKKPFYGGQIWTNQGPVRDPKSVSYISFQQWPGGGFPHYASGAGYIVSGDLTDCFIKNIYQVFKMPREDVFSGLLARACKIKPTQINGLTDLVVPKDTAIIQHEIKTREGMMKIWNQKIANSNKTV